MDLATILAPCTEETFFADYWENNPLHIPRAQAGYFRDLLTLDQLDEILSRLVFRADECKVARGGKIVPPASYVSDRPMRVMERTIADYVNTPQLLSLFAQGATLVFSQLNHKWQPLQRLKQEIERELAASVVTNVFLSNKSSQGFAAHYDSHDVFVLQLHGTKTWCIYDNPIELPLKSQAFGHVPAERGPLALELTLREGDLLYIPRGYFHEARTSDSESLHLTLGVHPYLWADLLSDLLDEYAHRGSALRRSVPRKLLESSESDWQTEIQMALRGLLDAGGFARQVYEQAIAEKVESGVAPVPGQLKQILQGETVTPQSALAWSDRNAYLEVARGGGAIVLKCLGATLVFPLSYSAMVEALTEKRDFTVEELPGTSDEQKVRFAKKLIGAGWLVSAGEANRKAALCPLAASGG